MTLRRILLGFIAGLLSAPIGLIIAYLAGVAITAIKTRELLATLLVAGSFLPLMLIFVLLLPTLTISVLTGLTLGTLSRSVSRFLLVGLVAGLVLGEVVLSILLPLIVVPQPGDFTSIVSNHFLSGLYGLLVGVVTAIFFQWMNRSSEHVVPS